MYYIRRRRPLDIIKSIHADEPRSVIKSIATVAIATPVAAQHEHHAVNEFVQISGTAAPYKPKFFSKAELDTVRVLVELIIPRTDTPGAADAGVDRIIDTDVSRQASRCRRRGEAG